MNENANKRAENTGHGNKPADLGTHLKFSAQSDFKN